jgi:hypothetical protein
LQVNAWTIIQQVVNSILVAMGALGIIEVVLGLSTDNTYKIQAGIVTIAASVATAVLMGALVTFHGSISSGGAGSVSYQFDINSIVGNINSIAETVKWQYRLLYAVLASEIAFAQFVAHLGLFLFGGASQIIQQMDSQLNGVTGIIVNIGLALVAYYALMEFATLYRRAQAEGLPITVPFALGFRLWLSIAIVQNAIGISEGLVMFSFSALHKIDAVPLDATMSGLYQGIANALNSISGPSSVLFVLLGSIVALLGLITTMASFVSIIGDIISPVVKAGLLVLGSPVGFAGFASSDQQASAMAYLRYLLVVGIEALSMLFFLAVIGPYIIKPVMELTMNMFNGTGANHWATFFIKIALFSGFISIPSAVLAGGTRVVKEVFHKIGG